MLDHLKFKAKVYEVGQRQGLWKGACHFPTGVDDSCMSQQNACEIGERHYFSASLCHTYEQANVGHSKNLQLQLRCFGCLRRMIVIGPPLDMKGGTSAACCPSLAQQHLKTNGAAWKYNQPFICNGLVDKAPLDVATKSMQTQKCYSDIFCKMHDRQRREENMHGFSPLMDCQLLKLLTQFPACNVRHGFSACTVIC